MMFTHHGFVRDRATGLPFPRFDHEMIQTIVHELVHAFGLPHICGYWDWQTPRKTSCAMNYPDNGIFGADGKLHGGDADKMGLELCGRHIKEIRRTHLEDNPGLAWK
jgi:hypothetical protein